MRGSSTAVTRRRALLVSHRRLDYGGVGSVRWSYLLGALPALGWDVEVVSPPPGVTHDEMSQDPRVARLSGLRARVMWRVGQGIRPLFRPLGFQPEAFPPNFAWSFTGRSAIRAAVETFKPDVIVATSPPPAALFASVGVVRGTGMPLVADMRDPWAGHPYYDAGGRTLTEIERRSFTAATAVVAVTDPMLAALRARHPALAGRMHVLPNGFDPAILPLRDEGRPDWHGRKVTLIHPGALFGERSVDVLVRALSRPELRDRIRLELLGNMNASSDLAVRAAPPELEIEVLPPAPWRETVERVARADAMVVIVPPHLGDELAWPVKMFEGLALGKPLLTLTGGGACERLLLDLGVAAGCARWDDADSVAAAVHRLLDDPPAPVPLERLARWDRSRMARDYADLLERVAGTAPRYVRTAASPAASVR